MSTPRSDDAGDRSEPAVDLYIELLKGVLLRRGFDQPAPRLSKGGGPLRRSLISATQRVLATCRLQLHKRVDWDPDARIEGRDWPADAETMIGLKRLDNLQECVHDVLSHGIPGDFIETGVWRGGATIFMRGLLQVYGDLERVVWVADSFRGLPRPDSEAYPVDAGDRHWTYEDLAVSLKDVQGNFAKYGLLDERVKFIPGWFSDTLPSAPIGRLAVLRLDGDMYESTIVALRSLYSKLSVGGYVIIDDYGAIPSCRAAVDDFRAERGVREEVEAIDASGVFWKREVQEVQRDDE